MTSTLRQLPSAPRPPRGGLAVRGEPNATPPAGRSPQPSARSRLRATAIAGFALTLAACAQTDAPFGQDAPFQLAAGTTEAGVAGDWSDADAAVSAAAANNQMAVLRSETLDARLRGYDLVTAGDRPVRLEITRDPDGALELSAEIGRFGDPEAEAKLLRDLAHRLGQLRGVGAAPIRW